MSVEREEDVFSGGGSSSSVRCMYSYFLKDRCADRPLMFIRSRLRCFSFDGLDYPEATTRTVIS